MKPRIAYRELQRDAAARRLELLRSDAATTEQKLERMADKVVDAAGGYLLRATTPLRARIDALEQRLERLEGRR